MTHRQPWTVAERVFLSMMWGFGSSVPVIANILRRSPLAVKRARRNLGLAARTTGRPRRGH
jgi:hypothetical protein